MNNKVEQGVSYLDGVDDTVMDNGLKFPGKVYLSVPRCLKLIPVFRSEVIGAAAAPVHNVFILALKTNVLLDLIRMLNIVDFIQLFISINPTLLVHVSYRFSSFRYFSNLYSHYWIGVSITNKMASENKTNAHLTWRKALRKETWFHGDISCDEAVARLSLAGKTGSFLVRFSHNLYIFSYMGSKEKVRHLQVPHSLDHTLIQTFPNLDNEYEVIKKIFSLNCPFFTLPVSRTEVNFPNITKVTLEKRSSEKYVCKICNIKAPNGSKFIVHNRRHKLIWCSKCSGFMTIASRYLHRLSCDPEPDSPVYECDNCKSKYNTRRNFKLHTKKCDLKKFKCITCEKVFLTQEKVDSHFKDKHEQFHSCHICGNILKSRSALIFHQQSLHDINTEKHTKSFFCPKCQFKTFNLSVLKYHIKITHDQRTKYSCTECSFTSKFKTEYVKHLGKHKSKQKEDKNIDIFVGF